ncbi:hypothetical protein ACQ9A5_26765, partial [Escherichia coli]
VGVCVVCWLGVFLVFGGLCWGLCWCGGLVGGGGGCVGFVLCLVGCWFVGVVAVGVVGGVILVVGGGGVSAFVWVGW